MPANEPAATGGSSPEPAVTGSDARARLDVHITPEDLRSDLEVDVRSGLRSQPKHLPPRWFYDDRGSQLFEKITTLPEYYPTRAERRLLADHAPDIVRTSGVDTVVELGAGSCEKTRIVLDALADARRLERYVALDVAMETARAASRVAAHYPGLDVHTVIGDFQRHLGQLPTAGRRLVAFLGGTIGNLRPEQRQKFLFDLNCTMAADDRLLLGTDLVKPVERMVAAYDDAAGVTAEFNRNVLHVLNRELGADFDPGRFAHVATWDPDHQWIEMRLRSLDACRVHVTDLAMEVRFDAGEEILTEISAKFTPTQVEEELLRADFVVDEMWGAAEGDFLLTLAHPYC